MDARAIFFTGKPGCGKGTQAKLLSEATGWPVFSSGALFRALAREETAAGRKVKEENDAGILQPHWFASYLFLKTLFSLPEGSGAIFDGFSRRVSEAEVIVDSLRWLERPFVVLNVRISDETSRRRLALRREAEGRADDAAVDTRLEEFRAYTEPALEIFRRAGALIDIDGEPAPDVIAANIRAALNLR